MKKGLLAVLLVCLYVLGLNAFNPASLVHIGTGNFAGKLATVQVGDTIMVVYNNMQSSAPYESQIYFSRNRVGSSVVFTRLIDSGSGSPTAPTITHCERELVVSYSFGTNTKMAVSTDWGQNWQIDPIDPSFDLSPVVFKTEESYYMFNLELPYPQWDQTRFLLNPDSDELKIIQHQTEEELTLDGDPAAFFGRHEFEGPVRTNSDLYIKQAGGGENNGWPIFNDLVMVGGEVISLSGDFPEEQIFRGGLMENAPIVQRMSGNYTNGMVVGPLNHDPRYIVLVEVDGQNFQAWLGVISDPEPDHCFVYPEYPSDNLGLPLFRNTFTVRDTIWAPLNSTTLPEEIYCPNQLWIKGTFSGWQNWVCRDTIKIIGDILLTGTPKGEDPSSNLNDQVSLYGERGVQIKYGYRGPVDSLRYHVAGSSDEPIDIYASIITGNSADRRPVFDFEYQHPHPSVPDVWWGDSLWTRIDLHRHRFWPTEAEPWPSSLDYPWYNPFWPESQPYLERGTIRHWGSVIQARRGYMHRSLSDINNPEGIWDITNGMYGGSSAVSYQDPVLDIDLQTQNYPGAVGSGIGYDFYTHYDSRASFGSTPSAIWPYGISVRELQETEPYMWFHGHYFRTMIKSKTYDKDDVLGIYAANRSIVVREEMGYGQQIYPYMIPDADVVDICLSDDHEDALIAFYNPDTNPEVLIQRLDPQDGDFNPIGLPNPIPVGKMISCLKTSNGREWVFYYSTTGELVASEILNGTCQSIRSWPLSGFHEEPGAWEISQIVVNELPDGGFGVVIGLRDDPELEFASSRIYFARLDSELSADPTAPASPSPLSMHCYPNPFEDEMTMEIRGDNLQNHRIEVYNLRGQLVRRIAGDAMIEGDVYRHSLNAVDDRNQKLASGVYLLKLYVDDKPMLVKRICVY